MLPRMRDMRAVFCLLFLIPLAASAAGDPLRPLAERREAFAAALAAAERGDPGWERLAREFADHPLAGYLEYAALSRQLERLDRAAVEDFLARHGELPVAATLRRRFLPILDRRGEHRALIGLAQGLSGTEAECFRLRAELALGEARPWPELLDRLWLSPKSLPAACDPLLALHRRLGLRTPERIRERLRLAAAAGEAGLVRYLSGLLPEEERRLALLMAEAIQNPAAVLAKGEPWPSEGWPREALLIAVTRLARRDPDRAEAHFERLKRKHDWRPEEAAPALAAIALHSALRFDERTETRVLRVPEAERNADLLAWRVRALLARGVFPEAFAALAALPPQTREEPRFRYLAARLDELQGRAEDAARIYRELAQATHWWAFLAAARLGVQPALCSQKKPSRREAWALAQGHSGLIRALELWQLGRRSWAEAEWQQLSNALASPEARAKAARLAADLGWHRAAIQMLAGEATQSHYRLRFPLAYREPVERAARRAHLEPALLFAVARAESAFDPQAQSPAGAFGLVQLLPATAKATARRLGGSPGDWRAPARNLELGAHYLRSLVDRYQGRVWLALAAYNAGPAAVDRWLARSAIADHPDLFIETIPFRETREYVSRVLAFAMIYRWRLERRMPSALAWLAPEEKRLALAAPHCPAAGEGEGPG